MKQILLSVWLVSISLGQTSINKPPLTIDDSDTKAPLKVTQRVSPPSAPATGHIYLDDGTNVSSTLPLWRRYTGSGWENIGQAYDVKLEAIADLVPVGGQVVYWTGPTTASLFTTSDYMRTVMEDANAVEAKASLHLDHVVDVRDYGAVGDGVTDDTAAIQAAIDSRKLGTGLDGEDPATPTGGTIYLPLGKYKITAPLEVWEGTWLVGDGPFSSIIYNANASGGNAVEFAWSRTPYEYQGNKYGGLRGLTIKGNADSGHGIYLPLMTANYGIFENLNTEYNGGCGIFIEGRVGASFRNVYCYANHSWGCYIRTRTEAEYNQATTVQSFIDCQFRVNGTDQDGSGGFWSQGGHTLTFSGINVFESNLWGPGLVLGGVHSRTTGTIYFENNDNPLYGYSGSDDVQMKVVGYGHVIQGAFLNNGSIVLDSSANNNVLAGTAWSAGGYTFTVTAANATAGAVYNNNGSQFTVRKTITGATTLKTYGTVSGVPSASGTLTLSSGTGDATITFSAYAVTPNLIIDGTCASNKIEFSASLYPVIPQDASPSTKYFDLTGDVSLGGKLSMGDDIRLGGGSIYSANSTSRLMLAGGDGVGGGAGIRMHAQSHATLPNITQFVVNGSEVGRIGADGSLSTAGTTTLGATTVGNATNIKGQNQHRISTVIDPASVYAKTVRYCIWPKTDAAITITNIEVTCDINPTTELTGDLKYADAMIGLANATVINDFDTADGVRSDSTITSASVAANKAVYIQWDTTPDAAIMTMTIDITFDYD